jgi:hypothetical protein
MTQEQTTPKEKEEIFNRLIVSEYLRYGSVDEVFRRNDYNLPISYPGVQRLLDKWGIVKAAGPNTLLTEALIFLEELSLEQIPVERLYRRMPSSFKASMGTMHRILSYIRSETIRRVGTALIITPKGSPGTILVGNDISPIIRTNVGKPYGSITFPMGYSKRIESPRTSILRVLQQEVFTIPTIERKEVAARVIPDAPKPFMYLDIADVRVSVYSINLPEELSGTRSFTSFKIADHRYLNLFDLATKQKGFRTGIAEIAQGYARFLKAEESLPIYCRAQINRKLALLPLEL